VSNVNNRFKAARFGQGKLANSKNTMKGHTKENSPRLRLGAAGRKRAYWDTLLHFADVRVLERSTYMGNWGEGGIQQGSIPKR